MEKLPKISIITPTLNAGETIEACILSVKNQTYLNKEHLIIDGQSTDGTLDILKRYADKYPQLKWISEKDEGIYDAMNRGIDLSSGDWLYFLGSDDVFCSDIVLNDIFNQIESSDFDIIYGNVKWGNTEQLYDGPFSRLKLLQKNICHQAIFTRKTIFDRIGKFDIKFNVCADYVFNMQWYNKEDIRHCYIDIAISRYKLDGYSSINQDMFLKKNRSALIEAYFPVEYSLLDKELKTQDRILQEKDRILQEKDRKITEIEHTLTNLFSSRSWRITRPLRQIDDAIRLFYKSNIERFIKPKKRRKINLNSTKIVYVGHSYHNTTKSTGFLIDYLKQFFDVEVLLDESHQGKPFRDISFVDESYRGVVFFQNLPNPETLLNIKNDNLIFFPMYDSVRLDFNFWNNYRDLKIINFSRTLHKKLKRWGFDSIYIQYFPDAKEFTPGNKDEVFFWQRITKLNIDIISKLFDKENLKIHIHKSIDPEHKIVEPSQEDKNKFQITYSDWFETREEMWDLIKKKGVYIAPRELEGIGLSFLEAMAMGKAVVAVNNQTMNEYIEHNKTGYLFELSKPKKIELSNIEQIQRNTYNFMRRGHEKWEKDKHKIIDFIKKS